MFIVRLTLEAWPSGWRHRSWKPATRKGSRVRISTLPPNSKPRSLCDLGFFVSDAPSLLAKVALCSLTYAPYSTECRWIWHQPGADLQSVAFVVVRPVTSVITITAPIKPFSRFNAANDGQAIIPEFYLYNLITNSAFNSHHKVICYFFIYRKLMISAVPCLLNIYRCFYMLLMMFKCLIKIWWW